MLPGGTAGSAMSDHLVFQKATDTELELNLGIFNYCNEFKKPLCSTKK